MTVLQDLLGFDPDTGEHRRAFMLRRLAQLAILEDREISQGEVARKLGLARQAMNLYFQGRLYSGRVRGHSELPETPRSIAIRERKEDEVERAIEAISAERGFDPGPAVDYIPEVLTRELMKAPA